MKTSEIKLVKCETIPDELEFGKLYYSDKYGTAAHLCACGCGNKVVTPCKSGFWSIDTGVSALSAPPRNCDVGTAEEQERRWHANCGIGIPNCKHCNVYEQARKSGLVDDKNMIRFDCRFIWAQMPYKEGGSK